MKKTILVVLAATLLPVGAAEEKVDLAAIHRIKTEAFQNSKVMEHAFYLTDVYGPRLTGSPGFRTAGEWAVKRLREYGLDSARTEPVGSFGRGWSCTHFAAHLLEPGYAPLIGFAAPWSPGTNGPLTGEPVLAPLASFTEAAFQSFSDKFKGKLKGKIVLVSEAKPLELPTSPLSKRYTDAELAELAMAPQPSPPRPPFNFAELRKVTDKLRQFFLDEGALAVVNRGSGQDGTVFGSSSPALRDPKVLLPPPSLFLATEHYNRIARLLEKKIPVRLEIEIQAKFYEDTPDIFNVIAEIPGGQKRDEAVMIGGHLDSWTGGTGATDNAAGCAVVMEVMRILKTLNLKMDRTVRMGLWAFEEGEAQGSKSYVKEHFADRETMALKPEHAKLAAYFNFDNGTGKIRGIYLQNNDMLRPVFEAWLAPFKDLGATTVSIRNTGGTDHNIFDEVGLPAFQFIQDPVEYNTLTHHSNMDVYDHLQAGDLQQAAAVMASFAYHAAIRDELLPRKPLPKPRPKEQATSHP